MYVSCPRVTRFGQGCVRCVRSRELVAGWGMCGSGMSEQRRVCWAGVCSTADSKGGPWGVQEGQSWLGLTEGVLGLEWEES
eukprot:217359-Rhodomonas_salina.2